MLNILATGYKYLKSNHRGGIAFQQSAADAQAFDRLADFELQHGHSAAAERFSHRAEELREAGR